IIGKVQPGHFEMTRDASVERVQAIIARVMRSNERPRGMELDTALGEEGLALDSVDFLEVLIACEAEFGVLFDPSTDFTPPNLRTVGTLHVLIRAKQPG